METKHQTIILLLGPKGSGKTFIGTLIQDQFSIPFIRVEDIALKVRKDRPVMDKNYIEEVFAAIEKEIRLRLNELGTLTFESTGITDAFDKMLASLEKDCKVIRIGVEASPGTCLQRVKTRDHSIHINVSDEQVLSINKEVAKKTISKHFVIKNENVDKENILKQLREIILKDLSWKN